MQPTIQDQLCDLRKLIEERDQSGPVNDSVSTEQMAFRGGREKLDSDISGKAALN